MVYLDIEHASFRSSPHDRCCGLLARYRFDARTANADQRQVERLLCTTERGMRAEWGVGALLYMGAARGCFCGVFWAETLRWDCGGVETEVLRFIQGVGRAVARWKQPAGEAARETVCSRHTEDGSRAGIYRGQCACDIRNTTCGWIGTECVRRCARSM